MSFDFSEGPVSVQSTSHVCVASTLAWSSTVDFAVAEISSISESGVGEVPWRVRLREPEPLKSELERLP